MITYKTYLNEPQSITMEECNEIYIDIVEQLEKNKDGKALELFQEMQKRATVYAGTRANWVNLSFAERAEADEDRSRKHDLFIKAKGTLAAYMYDRKMNIDWEDRLGTDRKRIGDFACYMTFLIALKER